MKPMEFFAEEGKQLDARCSTLVLPALSIGNVGQLAVDLLISTLKAEKIGYLDDPNVLPCVGNNAYWPFPAGDLALPLEVYESSSHGFTFIQQRSPVAKGTMIQFAKNLSDFAAANGKKQVVVISGLDFIHWAKLDMSSGLQVHYLSNCNVNGTDENCETLGWKKLPEYNPDLRGWKYLNLVAENDDVTQEDFLAEELEEEDYYPSLPFAALFSCFKSKGLKVTCLLCYCSEGDNTPDAFHLAEATTKLLKLSPERFQGNGSGGWIIPFSWKSVYGPPPDYSMF